MKKVNKRASNNIIIACLVRVVFFMMVVYCFVET